MSPKLDSEMNFLYVTAKVNIANRQLKDPLIHGLCGMLAILIQVHAFYIRKPKTDYFIKQNCVHWRSSTGYREYKFSFLQPIHYLGLIALIASMEKQTILMTISSFIGEFI